MSNPGSGSGDIFDVKRVRRLVEMMKEHDLAEIDLRQGDQRVRLRRGAEPMISMPTAVVAPALQPSSHAASSAEKAASAASGPSAELATVKSPMVGTFYAAANPESPPFVKVGDHVGPESIVCIIEAMKVFNEIPAEISGKITAVLVENGAPVEFGQSLFKVDTRQ
jgi:acetyl-CoA carboxylase biotin carboxyl carrier protein